MERFDREINLIGQENFDKITSKKVIVFGTGGVGGYVAEMLVRSGISNLTLVDFDTINITNLNRQIISLSSNVGQLKVEEFEKRIKDINPKINLKVLPIKLTPNNIEEFHLEDYDYVVDCIDSFKDKLALIEFCYFNNINIISSMGAGNRYKPTNYQILDIYKTKNDSLARKLRNALKKSGVTKLKVCCPTTLSDNTTDKTKVYSMSYNVALCGITLSSFIINDIIK